MLSEVAVAETAPVDVTAVAKANSLTGAGKTPFHLKLSFLMFDMDGKPTETGTVQEWWAGPREYRVQVTSPSLGTLVNPGVASVPDESARRAVFLVQKLLEAVTRPAAFLSTDPRYVKLLDESRDVRGLRLECVQPVPLTPGTGMPKDETVCWDMDREAIRVTSGQDESVDRSDIGTFAGVTVSMETQVAYGPAPAIKAHIETLSEMEPSLLAELKKDAGGKLVKEPDVGTRIPSFVMSGNILNKPSPSYPRKAIKKRIAGTVVLSARITEQGTIDLLTPIASPNELLTEAAVAAVKQWTYKPYLLNGAATPVETTITVNFALNGR